jgi:hypothetical protein
MADKDLVSLSAAAKKIGVNKSTLSRQVKAGSIRSHKGKVRLAEVLEDRANNIDSSGWESRVGGVASSRSSAPLHATVQVHDRATTLRTPPQDDDRLECACAAEKVVIDGERMTLGDAKALRETYRTQLEKLRLELASEDSRLRWEKIDRWRQAQVDSPSRPEAVRRLVEIALSASET